MKKLSERLSLIASFIPEGDSVCDVGTDHGYLPAYLCLSGKYGVISATDIHRKPLDTAQKNLRELGADKVRLFLCDGLEKITREYADTVIIAGMGGDVICGIIERCGFLKDGVNLIVQPMTSADVLRDYFAESGFKVEDEKAVRENGKIYSVMRAKFDGVKRVLSIAERYAGLLKPDCPESREYINKQLKICRECAEDLKGIESKTETYRKMFEASLELEKLLHRNGE